MSKCCSSELLLKPNFIFEKWINENVTADTIRVGKSCIILVYSYIGT